MPWFRRRQAPKPAITATAQMRMALHYVLAGDLTAAELALVEAARVDSSSPDVYMALANLYRARGDVGRAIQIHQNLLLRQGLPRELRSEALLGLALDFRTGGFLKRAAASFEELLEVERHNLQALRELERIRVETGEWEQAIRIRKRIGSKEPDTASILAHLWTGLGRRRAAESNEGDARKAFRRALGQDRRCTEAYLALGDQCMREGKPKKAIGHWRRVLDLHPSGGLEAYPRLWEAFKQMDDLPGFEQLLSERLDKAPDDCEASLWLSRALVEQRRIGDSLANLERLLEKQPGLLCAHAEIARTLLAENRDKDAIEALERLLQVLPLEPHRLQCRACGTQDTHLHWRCPQCGEWDSFQ
ncbi:MAG: tetratricopeptide repeat protein [Myxococcota bacterium]